MRFGICTTPDHLDLLEELGYDYIEMSVTKTMGLSEEEQEEVRRKLAASPVKCEAFNILFPKTMELIDGNTDEAALREYLHRAMALIKSFGAEVVVFGSGKCRRCPDNLSLREAYPKLVQVYRITGEVAKEYGITVVIEPLSRKETNTINLMSEGAMLEADVNMENVQLLSDYFHVMANHDSIESMETIRHFGHIHIASGNGRKYPVSEEGEEYASYIGTLKKIGYNGRISIEGKTENMEEDARAAIRLLRELEVKDYE